MSTVIIPQKTNGICDRCGAVQEVNSARTWPTNWAELMYRESSGPHETRHLCKDCVVAFGTFMKVKP